MISDLLLIACSSPRHMRQCKFSGMCFLAHDMNCLDARIRLYIMYDDQIRINMSNTNKYPEGMFPVVAKETNSCLRSSRNND